MSQDYLDNSIIEKIFQVPARLRIMSVLIVKKKADFNELLETLELTRGNLSMHIKMLNEYDFVQIEKKFEQNRPKTTYHITEKGVTAFSKYISILESIIKPVINKLS